MTTLPGSIHTRVATGADAARLARAIESMFRETFAESNDPRQMDVHCANNYSEEAQAAELAQPGSHVLLVEHGDDVIAFAQLELARPATHLHRFYITKQWHGKGLAQQLMRKCLQLARENEAETIWLSVWVENPRAIAFYRKFGFEIIGEQPFVLGTEVQTDYVMARSLK